MDKENNTRLETMQRVLNCEAEEIRKLFRSLDLQAVEKAMEMLKFCKGKIITSGCGTSGAAAKKVAHTLSCIETPAFFLSPSEALHGGMGAVQKEDVVILFSKGGHTPDLDLMAKSIQKKGASMIAVTEAEDCELARRSSLVLRVKIEREPDAFDMLATASTLAVIAVFDAIAIALANEKGYTKEEFLVIHPGGEVGERLLQQTGKVE